MVAEECEEVGVREQEQERRYRGVLDSLLMCMAHKQG
jgi:hypothetical protein